MAEWSDDDSVESMAACSKGVMPVVQNFVVWSVRAYSTEGKIALLWLVF